MQEKYKFPNYQEYWSSENCTFKGCPFRVTKFLLLNIKKREALNYGNYRKRKRRGPREWQLPTALLKRILMKKVGQFRLSDSW